jgi:hypothetical protein
MRGESDYQNDRFIVIWPTHIDGCEPRIGISLSRAKRPPKLGSVDI